MSFRRTLLFSMAILAAVSSLPMHAVGAQPKDPVVTQSGKEVKPRPSFTDSWYKVVTFRWNKLSKADCGNIAVSTTVAGIFIAGFILNTRAYPSGGWNAPDINAAREAEYRNLRQNVIPELAQHYGAGMGGRGAFEQNLANAQAGVQERLAALQNQRQFELYKLRQGQMY